MKVKALKDFKFSEDGFTIRSSIKGDIITVPERIGEKLVETGKAVRPTAQKKKKESKVD